MKKLTTIAVPLSLGLSVLLGAAAPARAAGPSRAPTYKIHWLLGHNNLDFFAAAAQSFKTAVETGSHGDIQVQIETASDPWRDARGQSEPEIAGKVSRGEAEMGHSFTNVLGKTDHRLWAFDCPYLMKGYLHMEEVMEGPIGTELLEGMRAQNLVGLAFTYSGGAQGVATTGGEIRGPEDLKGRKVGVFGTDVDAAWLTALGAQPVPIRHELRSIERLTRDGSIDSAVVTWRRMYEADLQDQYKYVSIMNSSYLTSITYINEKFYDGLPEKYRKLIKDATVTAARIERARTIELNEQTKNVYIAKGIVPVYLSDAARAKFQEALRPVYEKSLNGIVGKELIERIRKTGDAPKLPSGFETLAAR